MIKKTTKQRAAIIFLIFVTTAALVIFGKSGSSNTPCAQMQEIIENKDKTDYFEEFAKTLASQTKKWNEISRRFGDDSGPIISALFEIPDNDGVEALGLEKHGTYFELLSNNEGSSYKKFRLEDIGQVRISIGGRAELIYRFQPMADSGLLRVESEKRSARIYRESPFNSSVSVLCY